MRLYDIPAAVVPAARGQGGRDEEEHGRAAATRARVPAGRGHARRERAAHRAGESEGERGARREVVARRQLARGGLPHVALPLRQVAAAAARRARADAAAVPADPLRGPGGLHHHQQRRAHAGVGGAAHPPPVGDLPLAAGGGRRQAHHEARHEGRLRLPLPPRLRRQQRHQGIHFSLRGPFPGF